MTAILIGKFTSWAIKQTITAERRGGCALISREGSARTRPAIIITMYVDFDRTRPRYVTSRYVTITIDYGVEKERQGGDGGRESIN